MFTAIPTNPMPVPSRGVVHTSSARTFVNNISGTSVPEPSTTILVTLALLGFVWRLRKRTSRDTSDNPMSAATAAREGVLSNKWPNALLTQEHWIRLSARDGSRPKIVWVGTLSTTPELTGHSLSDGFLPLRCALIRGKRQCKIPSGGIHSAPLLLHCNLRIGKLAAV